MKKIFIVDEDKRFQASVKSVCRVGTVDLRVYTSSMEVLPLIEKEQPAMIFVNLELSDINDFVMYDLLKKADTKPPIPVIITYAEQSEKELDKYKKLKFKPDGFYKKVLSENDIKALVLKHLGDDLVGGKTDRKQKETAKETTRPEESPLDEDDIIFTEVMGETDDVMESFLDENGKDSPLADVIKDTGSGKPKEAVFSVSEGPSVDVLEKTKHRELAARLMSLEKQNHFLRTENYRMNDEVAKLKSEIKKLKEGKPLLEQTAAELQESGEAVGNEKNKLIRARDDFEQQIIRLKGENADLVNRVNDLSDKLTDKQREMIAKDHEFEKRLKNEADKLIHETEDRLTVGAREKEERLRADIARLENDKMRMENAHKDELHRQDSLNAELRKEIDALKNNETNLNAVIASNEEEKQSLSQLLESHKEKILAIEEGKETLVQQLKCSEEDLANAVKEKEKIEKDLSASIDSLTRELESTRTELENRVEKVDEYRNRLDGLGKLLQQALMLSEERSEQE